MLRFPPFRVAVEMPSAGWPSAYSFAIDRPHPDRQIHALTTNLRGFVVPNDEVAPLPTAIVLCIDDAEIWRAPIELARPDVANSSYAAGARRMGLICGFDAVLPSFLHPEGRPVTVCIETAGEAEHTTQRIALVQLSFNEGTEPKRHDGIGVLTINSLGRSGSSVLCRVLSLHPKLHVPTLGGQFGEVFAAGHLARCLAVLGSEGSLSYVNRAYDEPDFILLPNGYIGMDVQADGLEQVCQDDMQRATLQGGVDAMHRGLDALTTLARARKPKAAWWVEKSWSSESAPLLGALAQRWKEIILVREPQDFVRSQRLYLLKERIPASTIQAHLLSTPNKFRRFYASYRCRRHLAHLVRYEDLVARPRQVLEGIVDYLGLGPSRSFLSGAVKLLETHDEFRLRMSTRLEPGQQLSEGVDLSALDVGRMGPWFAEMCSDFGYEVPETLGLVDG